jgi:hypothetical protein
MGPDSVAKFESGYSNQEIRERDANTARLTVAIDPTGSQRDLRRYGMDRDGGHHFVEKSLALIMAVRCHGPSESVSKFEQCHNRNSDFIIASFERNRFEHLTCVFTLPLGSYSRGRV